MFRAYPVVLIAMLMLAIPTGYALDYNGSATDTCSADISYMMLEMYTSDGTEYTPLQSGVLDTNKVPVTKTENTYSANITEPHALSPDDMYVRATGTSEGTYTLSFSSEITGDFTDAYMDVLLNGSVLDNGDTAELNIGTYYPISVRFTGSYSGTSMPSLDLGLTVSAVCVSEGVYEQSGVPAVRLKATSSATIVEIVESSNPDLSEDYTVSESGTNHGNSYASISVSNDKNNRDGIADNNGQIDVSITIPQGYMFVIYLTTTGSNTFDITMSCAGTTVLNGTVTFNSSGWGTSRYYLSSLSYDGSSSGYFYTSLSDVTTYDAWMSGDTGDYVIDITTSDGESASRNLKMEFVFKKE